MNKIFLSVNKTFLSVEKFFLPMDKIFLFLRKVFNCHSKNFAEIESPNWISILNLHIESPSWISKSISELTLHIRSPKLIFHDLTFIKLALQWNLSLVLASYEIFQRKVHSSKILLVALLLGAWGNTWKVGCEYLSLDIDSIIRNEQTFTINVCCLHVVSSIAIVTKQKLIVIFRCSTDCATFALNTLPWIFPYRNDHIFSKLQATGVA